MNQEQIESTKVNTLNTLSRRRFFKASALVGMGAIMSGIGFLEVINGIRKLGDSIERQNQLAAKLDQVFPLTAGVPLTEEKKRPVDIATSIEVAKQESRVEQALVAEGIESAKQVITSPEYIKAQIARAEYNRQVRDRAKAAAEYYYSTGPNEKDHSLAVLYYTMCVAAVPFGGQMVTDSLTNFRQIMAQRKRLIQFLKTNPEVSLYLPPVGGKISPLNKDNLDIIKPTLTVEEQLEEIRRRRRAGELGSDYNHQMTVQGGLPDEFKFAALGLIISSPYANHWEHPFYRAPWGSIAPLVHDGGKVKTDLNPLWEKIWHRTDFLHRLAKVSSPSLEELESLTPEEKTKLSVDELVKARAEQEERDRLKLDMEFYQAAALCCHAYLGTAPEEIPEKIRGELSEIWFDYAAKIRNLLSVVGVQEVYEVPWFLAEPRVVPWWSNRRYEAEWPPIQERLLKLEEIRMSNPLMIKISRDLMQNTTGKVHQAIGLTC